MAEDRRSTREGFGSKSSVHSDRSSDNEGEADADRDLSIVSMLGISTRGRSWLSVGAREVATEAEAAEDVSAVVVESFWETWP